VLALRVALSLAALLSAFGGLDLALARRRHRKGLMMTREEVVRERREDEGDPRLKAERRRLHRALATAVPVHRATCLVVNPTHIAVALHHAKLDENAPVVVAKGVGEAAARLRGEARRAGVPVIHDVALARALFRLAEVGDEIPEELYEAAAAVLVHVHALAAEAAP
jgi:type III secretion protein U